MWKYATAVCATGVVGYMNIVLFSGSAEQISSDMTEPKPSLINEPVACTICYALKVDAYSPTFLCRGDKIFDIDRDKDISISSNETIDMKLQYSDSNFTAAHWAAKTMGVEAYFKAFSGAASMAVETTGESKYHTVRVDAIGVCTKERVTSRGTFRTHPEEYLTEEFKVAVKDLSVEDIESRIGVFYAIKHELGGMVKRTYVMEATKEDNESKVTAELKNALGKECLGVGTDAVLKFETGRRSSNKQAKFRREWTAQGGDTDLWFEVAGTNEDSKKSELISALEIAREWAGTITYSNVYPFDFELRPLWELIERVDEEKAKEFKLYLEDKWEKDANRHLPSEYLPTSMRVVQISDASKIFILNTCRAHESTLLEESSKAQTYLDNPMYLMDRKCSKRWQSSANSGREEALEIRNIVSHDSEMTVEELIEKLEAQSNHRFTESMRYLGLWGKDSKNSNEIEKLNKTFLDKIIKRLKVDLRRQVAVEEWHDDLEECQQQVFEAVEWFDENLSCMAPGEKRKNVTRAIGQVKDIQESLSRLLKRLEADEDQGAKD